MQQPESFYVPKPEIWWFRKMWFLYTAVVGKWIKKCCAVHSHLLKNQLSIKVVKLVLKFMTFFSAFWNFFKNSLTCREISAAVFAYGKKKSNFMISPEGVKTLWNNCKHHRGQEINSEALYISMYTLLLKESCFSPKKVLKFLEYAFHVPVCCWCFCDWIYWKNLGSGKSTSETLNREMPKIESFICVGIFVHTCMWTRVDANQTFAVDAK